MIFSPLALLPLLAAAHAAAAISAPSRASANANLPTSSDRSATFQSGNGATWAANNASKVDLTQGPVGWRISGKEDSAVIYNFTSTANIAGWAVTDGANSADNALDVVFTVNTTYTSSASTGAATLTTSPQLVPVTQTLLIKNVFCAARQNFTAHIALANGTTIRKTWIDHLHIAVPPETTNVTVRQLDLDHIADSTTVIYYGGGGLSAQLASVGGGDAPTVSALSAVSLKFCVSD